MCGDAVVNPASEQCDGADASACPGQGQQDCTCPSEICTDPGFPVEFECKGQPYCCPFNVPLCCPDVGDPTVCCSPGLTCDPATGACFGCSNGIVEVEDGEECDDGNETSGDGCSSDCRNEACLALGGDTDADTLCDDQDPCKNFANTLPLVVNPFSGIPCDCMCRDYDGDCFHSATDAAGINDCAALLRFDCVSERDEVAAPVDGLYSATDADLVNRVGAFIDPAYTLTCGLRPEATCGGTTGVSCSQ